MRFESTRAEHNEGMRELINWKSDGKTLRRGWDSKPELNGLAVRNLNHSDTSSHFVNLYIVIAFAFKKSQ